MKKMLSATGFLLQFFPLTVFLSRAFHHGAAQAADWLAAFLWGGVAALLQLLIFYIFFRASVLNRIILGVNTYLIVSCSAVLTDQNAMLMLLNALKESGLFLCILIVGIFTTFISDAGFVGAVEYSPDKQTRLFSLFLLLLSAAAVAMSFLFRGQLFFSAVLPLVILSVVNRLLKKRLTNLA